MKKDVETPGGPKNEKQVLVEGARNNIWDTLTDEQSYLVRELIGLIHPISSRKAIDFKKNNNFDSIPLNTIPEYVARVKQHYGYYISNCYFDSIEEIFSEIGVGINLRDYKEYEEDVRRAFEKALQEVGLYYTQEIISDYGKDFDFTIEIQQGFLNAFEKPNSSFATAFNIQQKLGEGIDLSEGCLFYTNYSQPDLVKFLEGDNDVPLGAIQQGWSHGFVQEDDDNQLETLHRWILPACDAILRKKAKAILGIEGENVFESFNLNAEQEERLPKILIDQHRIIKDKLFVVVGESISNAYNARYEDDGMGFMTVSNL